MMTSIWTVMMTPHDLLVPDIKAARDATHVIRGESSDPRAYLQTTTAAPMRSSGMLLGSSPVSAATSSRSE
jgi:hypothetical protein